jgi:hypothetical protein
MEGFFMSNARELSSGDSYSFVDPWSHKPDRQGPVPTDAQFIGAWTLQLGIDDIYQALFLVRGDRQDLLWSLTTVTENNMQDNLAARATTDVDWVKSELTCGCVAGSPRQPTESKAASQLLNALVRSGVHQQFPAPRYIAGLLTAGELANIVDSIEEEITRNTLAAEAAQRGNEAPILKLARKLNLNPRPAGHNTTDWIADCPRRKHSIMVSPSRDQFGCGYCRRKGGPIQLRVLRLRKNAVREGAQ